MRQIKVLDTETTGFEAESNSLVEMALVDPQSGSYVHSLLRPRHPISFGAMATHHILPSMVEDAPDPDEWIDGVLDSEESYIFVAHNAQFDRAFLPRWMQASPWVCTWRCALHVYPEAESHSNQALRYELGLDVSGMPREAGGVTHRALYDAYVTSQLFKRISVDSSKSPEELVELTKAPILLQKVSFGKHRGEAWSEVPKSYLRWVLGQDFDDDVRHTARHHL